MRESPCSAEKARNELRISGRDLTGTKAISHRAWALAEREQTDQVLLSFLLARMGEPEALKWLAGTKSYPDLPEDSGDPK